MYVSRCDLKLTRLRHVTSLTIHKLTLRHFPIRYEFYAAAEIQIIIKTGSGSFS